MRRSKERKDAGAPLSGSDLANDAAARLATIVNAAERAAEQVIDDAEAQAQQIIAEAETEGERLRGEALAAIERARRELGELSPESAGTSRGPHLSAVPLGEAEEEPDELEPMPSRVEAGRAGTPAGARLLATQMAVSGSSRQEIEMRLRNGFEIEDTTAILDAILGPED